MVFKTSKRITYFLIIQQLRYDKCDSLASNLERLFFNDFGNLDEPSIQPSNELQRIIEANSRCYEILSSAKSSLGCVQNNDSLLRRPKSSSSFHEEAVIVSQDCKTSSPVFPLVADRYLETSTISLKRGRVVHCSSSSSTCPQDDVTSEAPQSPGQILSELKKVSLELIRDYKEPQEQPFNSFLSVNNKNADSLQCDFVDNDLSTNALGDIDSNPGTLTTSLKRGRSVHDSSSSSSTSIQIWDTLDSSQSTEVFKEIEKISQYTEFVNENEKILSANLMNVNKEPQEQSVNSFLSVAIKTVECAHAESARCDSVEDDCSVAASSDINSSQESERNIAGPLIIESPEPTEQHLSTCEINETAKDLHGITNNKQDEISNKTSSTFTVQTCVSEMYFAQAEEYQNPRRTYFKFSDFGKPEDFANSANKKELSSQKDLEIVQDTANYVNSEEAVSNDGIESDSDGSCTDENIHPNISIDHTQNVSSEKKFLLPLLDVGRTLVCEYGTDLDNMKQDEKMVILKHLRLGWSNESNFMKMVRAEIPCARNTVLIGDILFAVFGHKILNYVQFKSITDNVMILRILSKEKDLPGIIEDCQETVAAVDSVSEIDTQSDSNDSCADENMHPNSISIDHTQNVPATHSAEKRFNLRLVDIGKTLEYGYNTNLQNIRQDEKLAILKILKLGWNRENKFMKRVRAEIPCSKTAVLGDILFAVFGHTILDYVKFKSITDNVMHLQLDSFYKQEDLLTILQTCQENSDGYSVSEVDPKSDSDDSSVASSAIAGTNDDQPLMFSLRLANINKTIKIKDNPKLRNLSQKEKIVIVKIIAEGWKRDKTFVKRVKAVISCAKGAVLGELLFALFRYNILTYIEFKVNKKNNLQLRLNPSHRSKDPKLLLNVK